MRRAFSLLVVSILLGPTLALGACSTQGFTVIYVNGVLNSEEEAKKGKLELQEEFRKLLLQNGSVKVINGYNPSHLGGAGDLLQSVTQAFGKPLSQYDLNTILMQIHPEVTTRKILLVGHSQGTFYTNEMYKYLIENGVPRESIAVYNIATPANYVAAGGGYVTSKNDKLINTVRKMEIQGNLEIHANSFYTLGGVVASALRANITVPPEEGHAQNSVGGHKLSVYLDGAAPRIVGDIESALGRLKSVHAEAEEGCFVPPEEDLTHKAKTLVYKVADPFVSNVVDVQTNVATAAKTIAQGLVNSVASLGGLFAGTDVASTQAAAVSAALAEPEVQQPTLENKPTAPAKVVVQKPASPKPTVSIETTAVNDISETSTIEPIPDSQQTTPQQSLVPIPLSPGFGGGENTSSVSETGSEHQEEELVEEDLSEEEGAENETPQEPEVPDTEPPATTTVSILECASSIVLGLCVVPTTQINLSWETAADAAYYGIVRGGLQVGTTTDISFIDTMTENATSTYEIVSYDAAGNAATSTAVEIVGLDQPVIINEVGWAGDGIDPSHQWIELKNTSDYIIELANLSIARSDGSTITLSGSIPAHAHNYASVLPADFGYPIQNAIVTPFNALRTVTSEQLTLQWTHSGGATTIDATPADTTCPSWCAGSAPVELGDTVSWAPGIVTPLSMERKANATDGTRADSWQSTDSYGPWFGTGGSAAGTLGVTNSAGYPEAGVFCDNATGLAQDNQPYRIGANCTYLMKFISGGTTGSPRFAALYRGTVGSSTPVTGSSVGKALAVSVATILPADMQEGEPMFFAMWEHPTGPAFDHVTIAFNLYFTASALPNPEAPTPPHGNYVVIPITYTSQ